MSLVWRSVIPCAAPTAAPFLSTAKEREERTPSKPRFCNPSAAEVLPASVPSGHANRDVQNLCLAFASSLRLHPRRALRLCWPGGTGGASASAVGRREGTPPYGGLPANGAQGSASRTTRSRACTAPHAKNHVIAKPVRTLAVAIRNTKNKFPSSEVIVYVRSIPYPQLFYHRSH